MGHNEFNSNCQPLPNPPKNDADRSNSFAHLALVSFWHWDSQHERDSIMNVWQSKESFKPCSMLRRMLWSLRSRLSAHRRSAPLDLVQLALVIPLGDEVAHHSTQVQIEILRKYGHNPGLDAYPHITLKMGFPAKDIAPIAEWTEHLANGISPFDISIRNFDFFDEGIMFLDVESNPELEKLRQRILTDLAEKYGIKSEVVEGPQFRFHVTLAYGLTCQQFAEIRKSYASRQIEFKFQAKHIDLFCHTGRQWVTYHRTALRPPPSNPQTALLEVSQSEASR